MKSLFPYEELPTPPEKLSTANAVVRMLDGLGFRYNCVTDGLTDQDADFRPREDFWSVIELMAHILELMENMSEGFFVRNERLKTSIHNLRLDTLAIIYDISNVFRGMSDEELKSVVMRPYKRQPKLDREYSFWYMINGQIADALAHVMQPLGWK